MPRGLPRGTDRRGIQGGMPPWSQGAGSCPAREGEAGSPGEVRATVGRGNAERFPLQVDFLKEAYFFPVMSEKSNHVGIGVAVPVHPKPMVEGGGSFWRGWRGTCAVIDYVSHH
jgi:hypothetical protein